MRGVEVVLVRHFHGRAKDRFQLQVAPIALRRFLAELEDGMALDAFGFGHAGILRGCKGRLSQKGQRAEGSGHKDGKSGSLGNRN